MSKTQLLYYKDPYRKDFSANIVSVDKGNDGFSIILDETFFYPEGGGQPGDRGLIGAYNIINTRKKDGIVYHLTDSEDEIKPGRVNCSIDWEHRFDYMQQHTGQHIISGVLYHYGYNTVSVHQGKTYTSIEVDKSFDICSDNCSVPPEIPLEELDAIEEEVNRIISNNLLVKTHTINEGEIDNLKLRRVPKVTGSIRIVEIEDYDRVACGGVHTLSTGEVIFAKVLFTEKIRGHLRIAWSIGNRVFKDYRAKLSVTKTLSSLFSVPEQDIVSAAQGIVEENSNLKKEIDSLKRETALQDVVTLFKSAKKGDNILVNTKEYINRDKNYIKLLLSSLPQDEKYAFCFVNRYDGGVQWAIAVTLPEFNFAKIKERLLSSIDGRGGGKAPFFQGVGANSDGVDMFFKQFKDLF